MRKNVELIKVLIITSLLLILMPCFSSYSVTEKYNASKIDVGSTKTDRIFKIGDEKYYVIYVNQTGKLNIHFKHPEIRSTNEKLWDINLMNSDGMTITSAKSYGYQEEQVLAAGVTTGTYYLKVKSSNVIESSNVAYSISVLQDLNACYEAEPNSNRLDANEVEIGKSISGSISNEFDDDWYHINNVNGGMYRVQFDHMKLSGIKEALWEIKIVDEYGSVYDTIRSTGNNSSTNLDIGLNSGSYYLVVSDLNYREAFEKEYSILITELNQLKTEKEFNNSCEESNLIELNEPVNGSLNISSDRDFYKLELNNSTFVKLNFYHQKLSGVTGAQWIVKLISEREQVIFERRVKGNQDSNEFEIGLRAGTYFVVIEPYNMNDNKYEDIPYLLSAVDRKDMVNKTEYEFNNDFTESNILKPKQRIVGSIISGGDVDCYQVNVTKPNANLLITLDRKAISGYSSDIWKISIYNEQQQEIDYMYVKGNKSKITKEIKVNKNIYYIAIQNLDSTLMDSYGILVDVK